MDIRHISHGSVLYLLAQKSRLYSSIKCCPYSTDSEGAGTVFEAVRLHLMQFVQYDFVTVLAHKSRAAFKHSGTEIED